MACSTIEILWENQRSFIPGRWGIKFIGKDPPPWTTESGQEAEAASKQHKPLVDRSTDLEGWMYASDFHSPLWAPSATRHCFVRRRRWVHANLSLHLLEQEASPHMVVDNSPLQPIYQELLQGAPCDCTPEAANSSLPISAAPQPLELKSTHHTTPSSSTPSKIPSLGQWSPLAEAELTPSAGATISNGDAFIVMQPSSNLALPLPREQSSGDASLAPSGSDMTRERLRSDIIVEAQSVTNSLELLLRSYGFNLDHEHFLLDGCTLNEADGQQFMATKESISNNLSLVHSSSSRIGTIASSQAFPMQQLDSALLHPTRQPSTKGRPVTTGMESVYFLGNTGGPQVPDTVWMGTVKAEDASTLQTLTNGSGETLWLDKSVCFNDTIAQCNHTTSIEGDSAALCVPTIVSARTPPNNPLVAGQLYSIAIPVATEPALSDDERSEGTQSRFSEPRGETPTKDHRGGEADMAGTAPPQLVVLQVQRVIPAPAPCGVHRYFVRARLLPDGGWVDSRRSEETSWGEDLVLCAPDHWSHLELRLCAIAEPLDGSGSPTPHTVGRCSLVPRSQLEDTTELSLPLSDLRGSFAPDATLLLHFATGHVQWSPLPRRTTLPPSALTRAIVVLDVAGCISAAACHPVGDNGLGPLRLEVTVVSAEQLLGKHDLQQQWEAPEVYIAVTLPDISPGWYHTNARDALCSVWNETLCLPVPSDSELTVLEVQAFTVCGNFFLGQALVPLHGLRAGYAADFTVRLGVLTESGGFLVSCAGPPRQLSLRVCPKGVVSPRPNLAVPRPCHFGWRFDAERQSALLCHYMHTAAHLPLPRREGEDSRLHVLEMFVEGIQGVTAVGAVALELRVAGVTLCTKAVDCCQGKAVWEEQFLVELVVCDVLEIEVVAHINGTMAGWGHVDLTRIEWDARDRHSCSVRLLVGPQVVAVVDLSLAQRPAGSLAWLVAAQRSRQTLVAECEAAWHYNMGLEAEGLRALFVAWEALCRRALLQSEEGRWVELEKVVALAKVRCREGELLAPDPRPREAAHHPYSSGIHPVVRTSAALQPLEGGCANPQGQFSRDAPGADAGRSALPDSSRDLSQTTVAAGRVTSALPAVHPTEICAEGPTASPALTLGLSLCCRGGTPDHEELVVASVRLGGPAAAAGLQAGDVPVAWNGAALRGRQDFVARLLESEAGRPIVMDVMRRGRGFAIKVVPALGGLEEVAPEVVKAPWAANDLRSPRQKRLLASPQRDGLVRPNPSPRTPSPSCMVASPPRQREMRSPSCPATPQSPRRVLIMSPRTRRIVSPNENRTPMEPQGKGRTPNKKSTSALGDISNAL